MDRSDHHIIFVCLCAQSRMMSEVVYTAAVEPNRDGGMSTSIAVPPGLSAIISLPHRLPLTLAAGVRVLIVIGSWVGGAKGNGSIRVFIVTVIAGCLAAWNIPVFRNLFGIAASV